MEGSKLLVTFYCSHHLLNPPVFPLNSSPAFVQLSQELKMNSHSTQQSATICDQPTANKIWRLGV